MKPMRLLFALALLAVSSIGLGASGALAQSPTAIAIPTATAEGCAEVPAYLDARQTIMGEFLLDLEAVFPQVATPIMENGDQLYDAILTMTPEQAAALGKAYDTAADKIEKVDAPPVARFYNDLQAELYRVSADVFIETGKSDLSTASLVYNDQLLALGDAIGQAGAAATGVCPAFADVVTFDQTQAGM